MFPKAVTDPDEKKFLASASTFCFPDKDEIEPLDREKKDEEREIDRFSFVLTADSGPMPLTYTAAHATHTSLYLTHT